MHIYIHHVHIPPPSSSSVNSSASFTPRYPSRLSHVHPSDRVSIRNGMKRVQYELFRSNGVKEERQKKKKKKQCSINPRSNSRERKDKNPKKQETGPRRKQSKKKERTKKKNKKKEQKRTKKKRTKTHYPPSGPRFKNPTFKFHFQPKSYPFSNVP